MQHDYSSMSKESLLELLLFQFGSRRQSEPKVVQLVDLCVYMGHGEGLQG